MTTLNDLIKGLSAFKEEYREYKIISISTEYNQPKDEDFRILFNDGKNVLWIGLKKEQIKELF